jgi:serine O-acetyltransferase
VKLGLLEIINSDLKNYGGDSFPRKLLILYFNNSFRLILNYRVGYYLARRRNFFFNLFILYLKKRQLTKYACDISYDAIIGTNIKFPHPIGIVIGLGAVVETNVKIFQGVTIGSKGAEEKVYPHIKSNVKIFSGAQILGGVTVGENSRIGAFSLVIKNVPSTSTAVGIPAKIL